MNVRQTSLEDDDDNVVDTKKTRNYVRFVVGSIRRHRPLALSIVAGVLAFAGLLLWALPASYHAEAKVLAQRNQALQLKGDTPGSEGPTRAAGESILRRSNLVSLIGQTDLLRHWDEHRSPAERLRDAIVRVVSHGPTEDERVDAMVERLEKKLVVWTTDGTVSIGCDWPDAQMARRLVDMSQQNYLETRYAQEITALGESLAILEGHATGLRADIDQAVARVTALRDAKDPSKAADAAKAPDASKAGDAPKPVVRRASATTATPDAPPRDDAELAQLRATITAKQRALDDLGDIRRRRLSEMTARLAELRATYTDNHPSVIDTQQTIAALSSESPQIKALRTELASLKAEQDGKAGAAGPVAAGGARPAGGMALPSSASGRGAPPLSGELTRLDMDLREDREPGMVYARGQLRDAMDKYAALREKVQASQIDLETAQAGFKYRYSVITPAQLPKRPRQPNVMLVLLGALLLGGIIAAIAAILKDVRKGVLIERWQVERLLDRPVLAEIDVPALPRARPE